MLTQEQIELRKNYIGGSDAATVLGLNKYKSKVELYLEKTGQVEVKQLDSMPILWGNLSEDNVAKIFEMQTGKKVRKSNKLWIHPEHEFMSANLDRVVIGEKAILECKTATGWKAKEWEDDEIPVAYLIQCLHYLAVTGYERAYIACMIDNSKFVWKTIERDEELINQIIAALTEFWTFSVLQNNPPAFDGSDAATNLLKNLYPKSNAKQIKLPSETDEIIEKLNEAKEYEATWKETKTNYENQLKEALKDNEAGVTEKHLITWKTVISNRIDTTLLKENHPDIYKEVCKVSASRRFSVK
ncbi:YqaJ viral recombinase family protein [Gottfriedia acidiceleris]|uniref:YqaJ viral recombinase family nuclease n=1 Tax=Gottfriedia acidiceleris TaxID=371036 RepID=UPI00101C0B71|nr:YqaJ viral recombinase family protein [Gottfriedia acidiceleris]